VQRYGAQVLINLQLIDARNDTHVWADSFDRKIESVFSLEREIAGPVADAETRVRVGQSALSGLSSRKFPTGSSIV
jgi:TolB-like protein